MLKALFNSAFMTAQGVDPYFYSQQSFDEVPFYTYIPDLSSNVTGGQTSYFLFIFKL